MCLNKHKHQEFPYSFSLNHYLRNVPFQTRHNIIPKTYLALNSSFLTHCIRNTWSKMCAGARDLGCMKQTAATLCILQEMKTRHDLVTWRCHSNESFWAVPFLRTVCVTSPLEAYEWAPLSIILLTGHVHTAGQLANSIDGNFRRRMKEFVLQD
jgi:hypothetical protein